ncbi:coiled-coil domain-containing protein [Aeromonas media]|uniref:hypothetical protein n=1 Tax=Aeromonas media TaxID=651 RepID=UPI002954BC91|nr:hypothetical protein [Aeromonas media]WOQ15188.1 hypothetical protein R2X36_10225 [Aeromonas media]
MAGVNVVLSAQTQKYISEINKAKNSGDKSMNSMGQKAKDMGDKVTSAFNSPSAAINGFLGRLGPVGLAIGAVGGASVGLGIQLANMGQQVLETQKKMESLAKQNNMSVEAINKYGLAVSTTGMDFEKFADILKDVNDRTGDYLSTGGGAMMDYFDTIQGKLKRTADDFRGLSAIDTLKMINQDLIDVGASQAQITFVMESISSDASKLTGILRMSESEMDNMLKSYAVNRATLSSQVANDIQATQSNMEMLQNNFNAAMANSFRGLITLANRMTKAASDALYGISEGSKRQTIIGDYTNNKMEINSGNSQDFLDSAQDIQAQNRIDARARATSEVSGLPFGDEYWKKVDKLYNQYMEESNAKLANDVIKASDIQNAARINSEGKGTGGNAVAPSVKNAQEANQQLQTLNEQRTNILKEQGRLETQLQNAIGVETKKALEGQITNQKDLLSKNAESIKVVNGQIASYQKEATDKAEAGAKKRLQAQAFLAKSEEESAKAAHEVMIAQLKDYLKDGSLTKAEYDQAEIIAEQKLQDKLLEIKKKKAAAEEKILTEAYNKKQSIRDLELQFATDSKTQADIELEIQKAKVEEAYRIDQSANGNKVLSEQDKNNKLAELDRNHKLDQQERDDEYITSEATRKLENAELERELILQQYDQGLIDKDEANRLLVESDQKVTVAKRDMVMEQLGLMSELFRGSSQLAKEGSKQQKILFALEKSSAIASLGVQMWEKWGKAENWGEKAMILGQYGGAIASTAAVTLGQFHDGTDEVSETGSYILKQGERVIQPTANKDLTSYLENNKSSGSGFTTINSDFIVQGNLDGADESRFIHMCLQHRDIISGAVRQSNMETGN